MDHEAERYHLPMPRRSDSLRSNPLPWFLFLALGAMWGSSYLFIKLGVESLQPWQLIATRLAIGAIVLWVIVIGLARQRLPRDARTYGHLVVMSVLNITAPFFLITWAEQSVDSALASIINGAVPLFVVVPAAMFLRDEPITLNRLIGLPLGFVGVVLLVVEDLGVGGSNALGALALLTSTALYGLGNVYARLNVRHLPSMVPALLQVSFALIWSTVLMFAFEGPPSIEALTPTAIVSVGWLGVFGSAFAYLAYFRLLSEWGANRTSLLAYLLPIVGIGLGVVVRDESLDAFVVLGTACILAGIAIANSRRGRRRLWGRGPVETA